MRAAQLDLNVSLGVSDQREVDLGKISIIDCLQCKVALLRWANLT